MKTFLRTTLFRFVAIIAFLIVSGFGYHDRRLTPVFNQSYLIQWIPENVATQIADKAVSDYQHAETQTLPTETPSDPATLIETDGETNATTLPASRPSEIETTNLSEIKIDIAGLSQQVTDQMNQLYALLAQQIAVSCQNNESGVAPVPTDSNAQRKAELQAQIDQLQSEMSGL
ncbi:MAG: hypothetical protein LBO09_05445 [Candidatus Peribacteria bacterium]|nr:hypothetical protein [Candidatus Peribacteria bacterium]